ncbi:MAG: hypothetical protein IJX08_02300 [Clostridia bacterium]|nr:hypothetical protein [Clostridia bacterium]
MTTKTVQSSYSIYVLTMRSSTSVSKLIGLFTKAKLTHSSIGFDPTMRELYSFARRHKRFVLPAGFIHENITKGVMADCQNAPCMLFEVRVCKEVYDAAKARIALFDNAKPSPSYDIPGILYNYFHKERENCKNYVCSRFVAETLAVSGAIELQMPASLYRPMDFLNQKELTCIYEGTLGGLRQSIDEGRLLGAPAALHTD